MQFAPEFFGFRKMRRAHRGGLSSLQRLAGGVKAETA
jgi:hypothetical protein